VDCMRLQVRSTRRCVLRVDVLWGLVQATNESGDTQEKGGGAHVWR
jgi:hypothetical protein